MLPEGSFFWVRGGHGDGEGLTKEGVIGQVKTLSFQCVVTVTVGAMPLGGAPDPAIEGLLRVAKHGVRGDNS
jgi:hypothetical protein